MGFSLKSILGLAALALTSCAEIFTHKGIQVENYYVQQPTMVDKRRNVISKKIDTRVSTLTRSEYGHFVHKRNVDILVDIFGDEYVLNLERHDEFISPNYHVMYGSPDGLSHNVTYGVEHCYYKGSIDGVSSTLLALSTCGQKLEGLIRIDGKSFIITAKGVEKEEKEEYEHVVYNDDDILEKVPFDCGVPHGDDHEYNKRHEMEKETFNNHDHSHDHSNDHDHSHDHSNDHSHKESSNIQKRAANRYVEYLAVNDYQRVVDFTASGVLQDTINLMSAVAQLYQKGTFSNAEGSIIVRIIGQYIPSTEEWLSGSTTPDANNLLDSFCEWRTSKLGKTSDALGTNDNAQLLSGRDFTSSGKNGVAGLAWVGTMCSDLYSCGICEARLGRTIASSSIISAHEMGHNFNSPHDSSGNTCPSTGFIMASVACSDCSTWSTCSTDTINTFLPTVTCLANTPTITYPDSDPCGNYVVDSSEDCDQGPSGSTCCNGRTGNAATSCKWKSGAVCDNSNPCCSNCQLRPTSYLCRAASGGCDLDDYCSASGVCNDSKKSDGASCDSDGICTSGNCISRTSQCSSLNSYRFTINNVQITGPFTPCNTGVCSLNCQGSTSTTCINMQNYNLPENQKYSSIGLPCSCSGNTLGTCPGNGANCNCAGATAAPTTPPTFAPTSAPCNRATCNNHGNCLQDVCYCDFGWAGPTCNQIPGCDGIPDSGKAVDACGVCGGDGSTCAGCDGVSNSRKTYDRCGVCGGTNACVGCDGVPNSGKTNDRCGVCGGSGTTCVGCDGIVNSTKAFDFCGVCGGTSSTCKGCDGLPYSRRTLDTCGICDGDGSTCLGCDGVLNSGKIVDLCGVCGGTNACKCTNPSSCLGCDGVINSGKIYDLCGVCGGNNKACAGCDGVPNSKKVYDVCGVCGGNNSTCKGCDGNFYSGKQFDVCGICGGNGQSCRGCDGIPNSGKVRDGCGVCGGDGITCAGCDGIPNSGATIDKCDVCNGTNKCIGCDGIINSGKVFDYCGVCSGDGTTCAGGSNYCTALGKQLDRCGICGGDGTSCLGCDGVIFSGKKIDACGICGGNNSTCTGCDGIIKSGKRYDACGVCGGSSIGCVGCDGIINSGKTYDDCGICGGDSFTCKGCDGIVNSGLKYDICGKCGGDGSDCGGYERIFAPRIEIIEIEAGKTYNISVSRLTPTTLVYYTTDGTAPNVISSTRYSKPFILDVTQFANTPTSTSGKKRADEFTEINVIVQFQAFPGPTSSRMYQSIVSRSSVTFQKKDDGLIGDGGATIVGVGVIAGAAVGGILALGLLIGLITYCVVSKRAKKTEEEGRQRFIVLYDYQAQNQDELDMKKDDIIIMKDSFGDGWARGYNERTRKEGAYPVSYVLDVRTSRLMLAIRPETVYNRISIFFGLGGNTNQEEGVIEAASPKPSVPLPPKPTSALPPKPTAPSPYYAQSASSPNPYYYA